MTLTPEQHRTIVDRINPGGLNPRYLSTSEAMQLGVTNPEPGVTLAEARRRYKADFLAAEKELRERGEID